jgi:predicted deacylase
MEEAETAKQELEEIVVDDDYPTFTEMRLSSFPPESINRFRLVLAYDGLAEPITVPVIVVKGRFNGPVLGITAALHGNELNGIPLIHKLLRELELDALSGTVVAIPVMNGPGFLRHQRGYFDGVDLNRLFPGKPDGNCGQIYVYQCMQKIVRHFNYHIDMHTASFGRVNSLYVRADMNNRMTHQMARLQEPQIIVHNTAPDGSLRSAAMKLGIPSITVEIGDPSRIHRVCIFASKVFKFKPNLLFRDSSVRHSLALRIFCRF